MSGENAVSLAHKYGHTNVLARLANSNCSVSANHCLQFQLTNVPAKPDGIYKSVFHYESEIFKQTQPENMVTKLSYKELNWPIFIFLEAPGDKILQY